MWVSYLVEYVKVVYTVDRIQSGNFCNQNNLLDLIGSLTLKVAEFFFFCLIEDLVKCTDLRDLDLTVKVIRVLFKL